MPMEIKGYFISIEGLGRDYKMLLVLKIPFVAVGGPMSYQWSKQLRLLQTILCKIVLCNLV